MVSYIEKVIKGLLRCQECNCDECCLDHASKAPWDCPAKDNLIDDAIELLKEYRGAKPLIDEISNQVYDCAKMFRRDDV